MAWNRFAGTEWQDCWKEVGGQHGGGWYEQPAETAECGGQFDPYGQWHQGYAHGGGTVQLNGGTAMVGGGAASGMNGALGGGVQMYATSDRDVQDAQVLMGEMSLEGHRAHAVGMPQHCLGHASGAVVDGTVRQQCYGGGSQANEGYGCPTNGHPAVQQLHGLGGAGGPSRSLDMRQVAVEQTLPDRDEPAEELGETGWLAARAREAREAAGFPCRRPPEPARPADDEDSPSTGSRLHLPVKEPQPSSDEDEESTRPSEATEAEKEEAENVVRTAFKEAKERDRLREKVKKCSGSDLQALLNARLAKK